MNEEVIKILQEWEDGELSEGQAARRLGLSRVNARILKEKAVKANKVHSGEEIEEPSERHADGSFWCE